jgi:hypothetical protein
MDMCAKFIYCGMVEGFNKWLLCYPLIIAISLWSCKDNGKRLKFDLLHQQNGIMEDQFMREYYAVLKKLETDIELDEPYGKVMQRIKEVKDTNHHALFSLVAEEQIFAHFNDSLQDTLSANELKTHYSEDQAKILRANVFIRNKLALAKHVKGEMTKLFFTDTSIKSITHSTVNGFVILQLLIGGEQLPNKTVQLRNIIINDRSYEDRECSLGAVMQKVEISLGELPKGSYKFRCTLTLLRDELPQDYNVAYDFEI